MAVLLETSLGDIVVDLYTKERPRSCLNFLKLCKIKYYNFALFHYVERNFIAQTGDPTLTGEGGDSIWGKIDGDDSRFFEAETVPRLKHTKYGTLSMVNNGNNCHASQFFITLREDLDYLDGMHTVFGEVAEGIDVLAKLNESHCDKNSRPLQDICIFHTVVIDDPYDDIPGMIVPSRSPSPPHYITSTDHVGVDEEIDSFAGKTAEEVQELISEKESKANAHILEMIGDIPDADGRPPENVLFVCKLNAVTTDEDLDIIFSRFGPLKSCEVIRDHKTGDSLQYAFIEFENEEDCVNAYFKMDNVLIDDRRIHVDFSQSLSKVKHRGRITSSQSDDRVASKPGPARKDAYDMVFDDKDLVDEKGKKEDRHKRYDSKKEEKPNEKQSKSRERSRERKRRERGSRSRSRERRHIRSRSRERRHNRSRSRERRHNRSRSRDKRERSRSTSRDKYHKSKYSRSSDKRYNRDRPCR